MRNCSKKFLMKLSYPRIIVLVFLQFCCTSFVLNIYDTNKQCQAAHNIPCMHCVVKLKHTSWCSVNLLSLIISSYLNPISLNTPLCYVLPSKKRPSEVLTEDAVTTENNGSGVNNLIIKTFDSNILLSCHTTNKLHGLKLSASKWIYECLYLP